MRSRSQKYLLGEQPTKRVLAEEKRYAIAKEITEIEYNHITRNDHDGIGQAFVETYRKLFGDNARPKRFQETDELVSRLPRLSDEIKDWLEEPITLSEVEKAIDELAPAKAPGAWGNDH